jgi:type IV secretory pathway VirB10-like protein
MSMQRSIRLALTAAIAMSLYGVAAITTASPQQTMQPMPPPPAQPMPPPPATQSMPPTAQPVPPPPPTEPTPPTPPAQPMPPTPTPRPTPPAQPQPSQSPESGTGFYQGTETSAQYPLPDSNGGTLTVNAGMPADAKDYGPPPSFATLDANHDGRISPDEAQAYPPLDSDFLYASGQGKSISRDRYEKWVKNQH